MCHLLLVQLTLDILTTSTCFCHCISLNAVCGNMWWPVWRKLWYYSKWSSCVVLYYVVYYILLLIYKIFLLCHCLKYVVHKDPSSQHPGKFSVLHRWLKEEQHKLTPVHAPHVQQQQQQQPQLQHSPQQSQMYDKSEKKQSQQLAVR